MVIYKYDLSKCMHMAGAYVAMPRGAQILHVAHQNDNLFLWAMIDLADLETKCERYFEVFGTGEKVPPISSVRKHIGTSQNGSFVWHVFERIID